MADAFGGRRVNVKPPERGIFMLDHDGECKDNMKVFLNCIKGNNSDHFSCREYSAAYLKCRMDKELMNKEDLNDLGLGEDASYKRGDSNEGEKEKKGFVAGVNVNTSKKWFFQR